MTPSTAAHAKNWPPSSAARFMLCPGSVTVMPLYPREDTDASEKGDEAHELLQNAIVFGIKPASHDPDMNENIFMVLEWISNTRRLYGDTCKLYSELRLDIPITEEFGTTDLLFVSPQLHHVADYKNGYVPVEIKLHKQMMMYLLGVIAKYGERPAYRITICQPNYDHRDGPIRTYDVTPQDIHDFELQLQWAVINRNFVAGPHCKKTYCEHRGNCVTFLTWAEHEAADAWFPSEVNALTNEQLAAALDHSDILQGIRDELRKEALRRIMNMDQNVPGYKCVKGRKNRSFIDVQPVKDICIALGASENDLHEPRKFTTVAGVERFIKRLAEPMGRGQWENVFNMHIAPHVRDYQAGLTLERAIDGRPAHKRGSEFGPLLEAPQVRTTI